MLTGDDQIADPSFYSYTFPEPDRLHGRHLEPGEAHWTRRGNGSLALLSYDAVRTAPDPRATLLAFLDSAYEAGAGAAGWPIEELAISGYPGTLWPQESHPGLEAQWHELILRRCRVQPPALLRRGIVASLALPALALIHNRVVTDACVPLCGHIGALKLIELGYTGPLIRRPRLAAFETAGLQADLPSRA